MERALRLVRPSIRVVQLCQSGSVECSPVYQGAVWRTIGARRLSSVEGSRSNFTTESLSESVVTQLKSARKSEEILSLVHTNELSGNQASLALSALRNSNLQTEKRNLSSDDRFMSLLGTLEGSLSNLSVESLVSSIINLFKLQQFNSPTVHLLVSECRQRLRGMSTRHLGVLVCHSKLLAKNASSASLVKEALRVLELRWREMNSPFLLKRFLKTSLHLSPSFVEKLEDKTLALIDSFSFQDLVEIVQCFTLSKCHSLLVLRAISYQVEEQRSQWEVTQLMNLVNNMRLSRFYNALFFKEVAAFCTEHLSESSPQQIAEMVRCFGLLRMPESTLFSAIVDNISNRIAEFSLPELQKIAFGLSIVKVKPPTQMVKRLVFEFDSLTFAEQIEVCLALGVFNAASADQVRKIFESTTAVENTMNATGPDSIPLQLKLLQLNTYARLECQDYKGPFLDEELAKYPKVGEDSGSALHRDVVGKLEAMFGNEKFFLSNVKLDCGYFIDAEIAFDNKGEPFSNLDYNTSSDLKNHSPLRKDLPEDVSRVAVVVHGPASYLHESSELSGRRVMMVRQLQALKYNILQVPYEEWSNLKSDLKKVKYLKEKLDQIIKRS